ncbi:MAG: acyltransferase [Flavipsychrobacter sp.]|nr:acyltransferase [Flavipsychrobacter sp.]
MNNRNTHAYTQLDSLRGIASVQIMNHHLLLMAPIMWMNVAAFRNSDNLIEQFTFYLQYSPLHLWYMADEAVVFFFVLSGFVLYSSLNKKIDLKSMCAIYYKAFLPALHTVYSRNTAINAAQEYHIYSTGH